MEREPGQEQQVSAPVERPLLAWLGASGPFAVLEALPILETLGELLSSLHAGQLLHDRLGPEHISVLEHEDGACILSLPEPARVPVGATGSAASEEVDLREFGLLATLLLTGEPPIRDAQGRGPLRPLWHSNPRIPFELGVMVQALVDDATTKRPSAREVHAKVKQLRRELEGAPPEPEDLALPPRRTTTAVFATSELLEHALGQSAGAAAQAGGDGLPFPDDRTGGQGRAARGAAPVVAGRLETLVELPAVGAAFPDAASQARAPDVGIEGETTDPAAAPTSARAHRGSASDPGTPVSEGAAPIPVLSAGKKASPALGGAQSETSAPIPTDLSEEKRSSPSLAAAKPMAPALSAEKRSSPSLRSADRVSGRSTPAPVPSLPAERRSSPSLRSADRVSGRSTPAPAPSLPAERRSSPSLRSADRVSGSSTPAPVPSLPAEKRSSPSLRSGALASSEASPLLTGLPRAARRPAQTPGAVETSTPRTTEGSARAPLPKLAGESETAFGPRPAGPAALHPRQAPSPVARGTGAKLRISGPPGTDASALAPSTPTPVLGTPEPSEAPTIQVELSEEQLRAFVAQPPERLASALAAHPAPEPKRWKTSGLASHPGEIPLRLPPQVLSGPVSPGPIPSRPPPSTPRAGPDPELPPAVSPWLQQPLVSTRERLTPRELLGLVPLWFWFVLGGAVLLVLLIWLGTAPTDSRPGLPGTETELGGIGQKSRR